VRSCARATAGFLQREAKWAAAEAKDLRLDLGRWLARFEQARHEVEAHPTEGALKPEVIEKRRGGMLRQARLDDAAALKARAAGADLRRSEDRLARRAADARRRRAKGREAPAATADVHNSQSRTSIEAPPPKPPQAHDPERAAWERGRANQGS
jgi:hypothetical protein